MEKLYFSIFSSDEFKLKSDNYDYLELEMWLPKFANLFQNKKAAKDRLLAILDHLSISVNFGQMSKSIDAVFYRLYPLLYYKFENMV